ncbi:MAG TPA: MFS transporter [Gaiellaceae bacterium]|nr:MFS transporter [Gaiellaceae bacterium]
MRGLGSRAAGSAAAFAEVFRNPNLRWLELAWTASIIGHYAYLIAVSVYAYEVGGASAVGLVFLARLIPAAIAAPFAGLLGDRFPRERVLIGTNLTRIVLVGAAAIAALAEAEPIVVYVLAIAATIVNTPFRSAQAALTPTLARSPSELTAANAVASGVDSLAFFIGPALAGIFMAVASSGVVFAITAGLIVISTLFLLLIRIEETERPRAEIEANTVLSELFAGFRAIGSNRSLSVLMALVAAQPAVAGAVQVFVVVASVELFDLGTGGVGLLNSAIGIGAFLGAIAALSLTGVRRLSPAFMAGIATWGFPLMLLGIWPEAALAVVLFAVIGFGNSIAMVAGMTLVQRTVADEVMARVFGIIQMLVMVSMGIGAALAPALISAFGIEGALIAAGAFLPVLVALLGRPVARIDATAKAPSADELRILTGVPIFTPLPGASLEQLAARLVPLRVEAGSVIVREGDEGDRFYIVADGELEVSQDHVTIGGLVAGDYFGEIALLRDTSRTATVIATTDAVLYALDREDFLAAVTGHAQSAEAAETVMSARLAGSAATGYRSAAQ